MPLSKMQDTAEITLPDGLTPSPHDSVASAQVEVNLGCASHPGRVRPNNEDHFLTATFGRYLHTLSTNLPGDLVAPPHAEVGYVSLVADGMGGMAAGEVASRTAIQSLVRLVLDTPDWILGTDEARLEALMQRMADRFRQIDEMLLDRSRADPRLHGMGTTLTLACSLGLDLVLCHIGDSRAYLFRAGELHQRTRDMTMAQAMLDAGLLTPAEAASHRTRHMLTQCLGGGREVTAEVQHMALHHGDRLLLCSDGLSEMVPDEAIADLLRGGEAPQATCEALIDRALVGGGRDNVTVVLADYRVRAQVA
jgi:protein phosphatase